MNALEFEVLFNDPKRGLGDDFRGIRSGKPLKSKTRRVESPVTEPGKGLLLMKLLGFVFKGEIIEIKK